MPHRRILILWPSFIAAALATACFFSIFDPQELTRHGTRLFSDRLSAYSVFFLCAWGFGAVNAVMILLLSRNEQDVNGFSHPPVNAEQYADQE